jgi:hypothetical protein
LIWREGRERENTLALFDKKGTNTTVNQRNLTS